MMNLIVIFFRFLLRNKWKLFLTIALTLVFTVIYFPLSDFNDLLSSQVAKLTGNRVYLQVDNMHINPITTSLTLDNVVLETPEISSVTAKELLLSPSLSALISKKPAGHIKARGLLNGDVEVFLKPVESSKGTDKSRIEITASRISLKEARQLTNFNLPIKGELHLNSQAIADLSFTEQPDLDLNLVINKFELGATSVPLQDFGQISLPELKLGKIELKGRLSNGKFTIENGKLGQASDEFSGQIKGDLALSFQNMNGQITPVVGAYNFIVEMKASPSFKNKAQLFLSFLDGYKTESADSSSYKFKISAMQMGLPPQFSPMK